MTQPTPLISVVTPAWNAAGTLQRAHDSLRLQDCRWEHVIVNDGSTDETAPIAEALCADSRVRCVTRGNGGPGAAINSGLDAARGDYIAFLDADDEYLPGHLSSRLRMLESDPGLDLVWGGMEVILRPGDEGLVPDVACGSGFIPIFECVVQGTIFGRRNVFTELRFSEVRDVWYQDYDFVRRAAERFRVHRADFPTYRYYRNSSVSLVDRVKAGWPASRLPE